jgi:hypothetical protein
LFTIALAAILIQRGANSFVDEPNRLFARIGSGTKLLGNAAAARLFARSVQGDDALVAAAKLVDAVVAQAARAVQGGTVVRRSPAGIARLAEDGGGTEFFGDDAAAHLFTRGRVDRHDAFAAATERVDAIVAQAAGASQCRTIGPRHAARVTRFAEALFTGTRTIASHTGIAPVVDVDTLVAALTAELLTVRQSTTCRQALGIAAQVAVKAVRVFGARRNNGGRRGQGEE